jgi:FtsH-binding integral membrane protein
MSSQIEPTPESPSESPASDRRMHVVACALGIVVVAVGNFVAVTLSPVFGLVGYLLFGSALAGTLVAVVGMRHNPPRRGRLALALTAVPAVVVVVMLAFVALMFLALGGGNPNS